LNLAALVKFATRHTMRISIALATLLCTIAFVFGHDNWDRPLTEPTADAAYYYGYLPTMVIDGDLDFDNQYQVTKNWYGLGKTPSGRTANVFGVGPAVFELPGFFVGRMIAWAAGARMDGFSIYETTLALWMAIPFSIAAVLLAFKTARRHVAAVPAACGAVVAALGGSLLYYAIRQPGYAHPFAAFSVALLVYVWDGSYRKAPRSLRTWAAMGAALGLAMLARPQLALWGMLLVHAVIDDLRYRSATKLYVMALRWCLAMLIGFALLSIQLGVWRALYGSWYVVPQGSGFMRWDAMAWTETLFSSRNGLFPWAPAYFLLAGGLFVIPSRSKMLLLLGCVIAQAFVNGAAWDWWGGGAYGGRRFDSAFVVFAIGGAGLAQLAWTMLVSQRAVWIRRCLQAVTGMGLVVVIACVVAQVRMTFATSVVSARIGGGQSASSIWLAQIGGVSGHVASWLSSAATVPVRAAFAWRHDVGMSGYDQMVGVHRLGETYPGLNRKPDQTRETINLADIREPMFRGFASIASNRAQMVSEHARIYIGLNRRGALNVKMQVVGAGVVVLAWNGTEVGRATAAMNPSSLQARFCALHRGANWLEFTAPVGTEILALELVADSLPCE
jgi:hypothetical protein